MLRRERIFFSPPALRMIEVDYFCWCQVVNHLWVVQLRFELNITAKLPKKRRNCIMCCSSQSLPQLSINQRTFTVVALNINKTARPIESSDLPNATLFTLKRKNTGPIGLLLNKNEYLATVHLTVSLKLSKSSRNSTIFLKINTNVKQCQKQCLYFDLFLYSH